MTALATTAMGVHRLRKSDFRSRRNFYSVCGEEKETKKKLLLMIVNYCCDQFFLEGNSPNSRKVLSNVSTPLSKSRV
jgi:hypothetical protein